MDEGNRGTLFEEGIHGFKKIIIYTLMAALCVTIGALTISLLWLMGEFLVDVDFIIIDKTDILGFLGFFLLIVICIELLDTLIVYTKKHVVKVEIVILVAITAAARELIVQNYETVQPALLVAIGSILIAAALSYFMVRKVRIDSFKAGIRDEEE